MPDRPTAGPAGFEASTRPPFVADEVQAGHCEELAELLDKALSMPRSE